MSMQSEKLAADIKILIADAEELIRATAAETGEKVVDLRRRVQHSAQDVKAQLSRLERVAIDAATARGSQPPINACAATLGLPSALPR